MLLKRINKLSLTVSLRFCFPRFVAIYQGVLVREALPPAQPHSPQPAIKPMLELDAYRMKLL